ncbi:MAG: hypothetical protein Q8R11_01345 [bacterium]|nr:hypothetical protein [bacterium]
METPAPIEPESKPPLERWKAPLTSIQQSWRKQDIPALVPPIRELIVTQSAYENPIIPEILEELVADERIQKEIFRQTMRDFDAHDTGTIKQDLILIHHYYLDLTPPGQMVVAFIEQEQKKAEPQLPTQTTSSPLPEESTYREPITTSSAIPEENGALTKEVEPLFRFSPKKRGRLTRMFQEVREAIDTPNGPDDQQDQQVQQVFQLEMDIADTIELRDTFHPKAYEKEDELSERFPYSLQLRGFLEHDIPVNTEPYMDLFAHTPAEDAFCAYHQAVVQTRPATAQNDVLRRAQTMNDVVSAIDHDADNPPNADLFFQKLHTDTEEAITRFHAMLNQPSIPLENLCLAFAASARAGYAEAHFMNQVALKRFKTFQQYAHRVGLTLVAKNGEAFLQECRTPLNLLRRILPWPQQKRVLRGRESHPV